MTTPVATPGYPFTAVVGHDDLRLALLLNAVHPGVGGVLVRGEKGTAKSTAVRALAALLPELVVVPGCRFGCDPADPDPGCPDGPHGAGGPVGARAARLVELPVGATEDRLVGSLDLERALAEGVRAYQPGLLADAHRGVLYVDEVNLLHDHLVDLLLDAAAMGRAHVERDGVSVSHASRFLLVGHDEPGGGRAATAAPRPVRPRGRGAGRAGRGLPGGGGAPPARVRGRSAGVRRALGARRVRRRGAHRRRPVPVRAVGLPDAELRRIAAVCAAFDVDGMRADLVIARAAVAHAAWRGAAAVTEEDVRVAARLALPHRRRRDPFDEPGVDEDALDDALREAADREPPPDDPDGGPGGTAPDAAEGETAQAPADDAAAGPPAGSDGTDGPLARGDGSPRPAPAPSGPFRARLLQVPGIGEGAPGRRSRARTGAGRVVRASGAAPRRAADVHLPATLTAAAPHQRSRGRSGTGLLLRPDDLRRAEREGREGNLVLFAVDASGSMAARARMAAVGGAVLSLLRDAYQRRDKVGLISIRAGGAELVLPPTSSVPAAQARLAGLRTGGPHPARRRPAAGPPRAARRAVARPFPPRPARAAHRRPGHRRRPRRRRPRPRRLPGGRRWPPTASRRSWSTARAGPSGSGWRPGSPPRRAGRLRSRRAVRRPRGRRRAAPRAQPACRPPTRRSEEAARCHRDRSPPCRTTG